MSTMRPARHECMNARMHAVGGTPALPPAALRMERWPLRAWPASCRTLPYQRQASAPISASHVAGHGTARHGGPDLEEDGGLAGVVEVADHLHAREGRREGSSIRPWKGPRKGGQLCMLSMGPGMDGHNLCYVYACACACAARGHEEARTGSRPCMLCPDVLYPAHQHLGVDEFGYMRQAPLQPCEKRWIVQRPL